MHRKTISLLLQRVLAILLLMAFTVSPALAQTPQAPAASVRQSDSLMNGALIGAASGAAFGVFYCSLMEPWELCRTDYGSMMKMGAIGAGIGIGIDALIRKNVTATPIVTRQTKGVRFSVRF